MTATINSFLEKWSQHSKPNECKNIDLGTITRSKEKRNLPLGIQPSSLHYRVIEPRFGFAHQPFGLEQEALFHLHQCNTPEAAPPRWLQKVL